MENLRGDYMACPTKEEYQEALGRKDYLNRALNMTYKHREELLDELCALQESIKVYESALIDINDVLLRYKAY